MDNQSQANMPPKQVIWVLWVALLISQIVVASIGHLQVFSRAAEGMKENVLMIYSGIAMVIIFVSQIFYKRAKDIINTRANSQEEETTHYQQSFVYFLLSWALGESITILGMTMPLIGGVGLIEYAYSFFAIGIGLHFYRRPI